MSQDIHNASRELSPPRRGNLRTDIASEAYGGGCSVGPGGRVRDGDGGTHPRRASPDHGHHLLRSSSPSRTASQPQSLPREEHARTPSRHRTPTPIPDTQPSEAYLAAAITSSTPLSFPSDLRKLLILDLNGSLLIRAGHRAASTRVGEPRLRPVHPRPYMSSFRNYLFHEETRRWLDVMVWSSAQPHSVDSMVDECFGGTKNALVAVWARDTLGLSATQYNNKVQTVKDLTKPWAHLPLSAGASSQTETAADRQTHSAASTLLLDDSPVKARLQPHNHVCLREYDASLRATDLARLGWERSSSSPSGRADDERPLSKSEKKRQERAGQPPPAMPYDATLLAIVGVLDAIKVQSNIAGWIHSGGLWGPFRDEITGHSDEDDQDARSGSPATAPPDSPPPEAVPTGADVVSSSAPGAGADTSSTRKEEPKQLLWFDDIRVITYWEERGRRACEELSIMVEHGLEK